MRLKIGALVLDYETGDLPSSHTALKKQLRNLAKICGVSKVRFVNSKSFYAGYYDAVHQAITVVEKEGARKVPKYALLFRFLHELGHHIQLQSGLFAANYYASVELLDGAKKIFSQADRKRVALRAERHADWVACKLAEELYGVAYVREKYPKKFLQKHHNAFASK